LRCNVARGKYRFRVYNGSNARFYNLRFLNGLRSPTFYQIGSDGGLLNAPVPLNQLLLAPGERADLVVDFAGLRPGATITLFNGAVAPYPSGPRLRRRGGAPLYRIMQFTVTSAAGWTKPIPAKLRVKGTPLRSGQFDGVLVRLVVGQNASWSNGSSCRAARSVQVNWVMRRGQAQGVREASRRAP